jgi:hypothetical protein
LHKQLFYAEIITRRRPKLKKEELYFVVLAEARRLYREQPYKRKNIPKAVYVALNMCGVVNQSLRATLNSDICRELGHVGGNASFVSRN